MSNAALGSAQAADLHHREHPGECLQAVDVGEPVEAQVECRASPASSAAPRSQSDDAGGVAAFGSETFTELPIHHRNPGRERGCPAAFPPLASIEETDVPVSHIERSKGCRGAEEKRCGWRANDNAAPRPRSSAAGDEPDHAHRLSSGLRDGYGRWLYRWKGRFRQTLRLERTDHGAEGDNEENRSRSHNSLRGGLVTTRVKLPGPGDPISREGVTWE